MPKVEVRTNDGTLVEEFDMTRQWVEIDCGFARAAFLAEIEDGVARARRMEQQGAEAVYREEESATHTLHELWEMEMRGGCGPVLTYRIPGHGVGWQFLEREDAGGNILMVRWTDEGREEWDFPADTAAYPEEESSG